MLSLSTPEYAVRRIVRAISSAIERSVFLKSSNPIGSRRRSIVMGPPVRSDLSPQVDRDVAVCVEPGVRAGWHDARRVVLLDDARAHPRRGQRRAIEDRRLAPAEAGPEVHAPCGLVA